MEKKERRSKRMEASSGIPLKSSSGAGGEVRRIHIIYFLSHNLGRFEHPHLIRVHHFNLNGVYLRDVKRWLADLRGKDMPKAFAWSYKRRYKKGYVWQDLLDDDLITPISDNEYVLKGSEIFVPPANPLAGSAYGEKKAADLLMKSENDSQVENTEVENKAQDHEQLPSPNQICDDTTPRKTTSSEISEESPVFSSEISTVTDDSIKEEEDACKPSNPLEEEQIDIKVEQYSSFYTNFLGSKSKKNQKKRVDNNSNIEKMGTPSSFSSLSSSTSSSQATFAKSKSYSSGTSKMLRNLMTCGAVDTNDAALVRQGQKCNSKYKPIEKPADQICEGEVLGGPARVFATPWNQQIQQHDIANASRKSYDEARGSKKQPGGFGSPKVIPPAYKPVAAPICSRCGKSFRPEKLHSHMKSCRGLKTLTKAASAYVEKTPSPSHISVDSKSEDGYFLTK
ncbi:protein SOSEKI 1 isoform X1 [Populus trichocarpa]|uniref:protein SOSEKI 1 isoform X1 n=2 Tax=Populus trichocarpa TaxID=3694 RepID=UPI002279E36C|nr:protein SOSEKI 1 isoform X1 [Populus trichocarpa]